MAAMVQNNPHHPQMHAVAPMAYRSPAPQIIFFSFPALTEYKLYNNTGMIIFPMHRFKFCNYLLLTIHTCMLIVKHGWSTPSVIAKWELFSSITTVDPKLGVPRGGRG